MAGNSSNSITFEAKIELPMIVYISRMLSLWCTKDALVGGPKISIAGIRLKLRSASSLNPE